MYFSQSGLLVAAGQLLSSSFPGLVHPGSQKFFWWFLIIGSCNFSDVGCHSFVDKRFHFQDVAETKSHLFFPNPTFPYLLPLNVDDSSDGAVMERF